MTRALPVLLIVPWLLACSAHRSLDHLAAAQQVRDATSHYVDLVLAMDHAGIAALFTSDGEIVADDQKPIRGPAAIQAHLEGFEEFHVLEESLTTDSVSLAGDRAHVAGRYRQKVRIPSVDVVEVGGDYIADWVRDFSGAWHIRRMATVSHR